MSTRGWEGVKASDLKGSRTGKYGAKKTVADGITFDSKKEAQRYHELKLMQQSGQITQLRFQPRYTLFALTLEHADLRDCYSGIVSNRRQFVCEYVADFEYRQTEGTVLGIVTRTVVEDVKSPATRKKEVYRLKRKLFEAQYGITIREV